MVNDETLEEIRIAAMVDSAGAAVKVTQQLPPAEPMVVIDYSFPKSGHWFDHEGTAYKAAPIGIRFGIPTSHVEDGSWKEKIVQYRRQGMMQLMDGVCAQINGAAIAMGLLEEVP